jgi:hypothetical protein
MGKKGQGMQFNWIFVVIAGAVLLSMFAGFAVKYVDLRESRNDAEIGRGLDHIFLSAKSTAQYKPFDIGREFDINFLCDEFVINKEYRQEYDYVVFGDDAEDVDELIIWSREFKHPFRVDNIIYVFDPRKTVAVSENVQGFVEGLPEGIQVVSSSQADIVVNVNSLPYNDLAFVYAAMVSNENNFECGVRLLEDKFKNVKAVYYDKASSMPGCISSYADVKSKLDTLFLDSNVEELVDSNRALSNLGCGVVF